MESKQAARIIFNSGAILMVIVSAFFTVFARTEGEAGKLSAFIVEKAWPGVAVGPTEHKMGIRASSTTTVSFSDVILPAGAMLVRCGCSSRGRSPTPACRWVAVPRTATRP